MKRKGRRTKLNEATKSTILKAISTGATYEIAANLAGVSRSTLNNWLQKGEEQTRGIYSTFLDDFKKAEARCMVAALVRIKQAADSGTWQAAAWLLERRCPEYRRDAPPPVQVSIDIETLDSRALVAEYRREIQPLLSAPTIDLDEE